MSKLLLLMTFFALNVNAQNVEINRIAAKPMIAANHSDLEKMVDDMTAKSKFDDAYETIETEISTLEKSYRGQAPSCTQIAATAPQLLAKSLTPAVWLQQVAQAAPDILLLGEMHAPMDFLKWEQDTIKLYRQLRPEVDCIFRESPMNLLETEIILYGKNSYEENSRDLEKTVQQYARQKTLKFVSYKKVGQEPMEQTFVLGEETPYFSHESHFVEKTEAYIQGNNLIPAFEDNLKNIDVDLRHKGYSRDAFMTGIMSGLIKNGYCKAAVGIFGQGHIFRMKHRFNRLGISTITAGLWATNSHKISHSFYGDRQQEGFMNYSNTCPGVKIQVPQEPIAIVSDQNMNMLVFGREHDSFKFTLNMFDAHIVAPVLPVKEDMSNYDQAIGIYAYPIQNASNKH